MKDKIFSTNSKVLVSIGTKKIHLKGYGIYAISINPGETIIASQLWTKSKGLTYDEIIDGSTLLIKPRFGQWFTIIVAGIFFLGAFIFVLYRFRWSFMPLALIAIYISLYLTILRDRYLLINLLKKE